MKTYFHHIHPPSLFPYMLPLLLVPTPRRLYFTFLPSVFEKRHFCLIYLYREFHYDISKCTCMVSRIGSSPPFFSFSHYSPSYGDFFQQV
jgi:hypothetical protein